MATRAGNYLTSQAARRLFSPAGAAAAAVGTSALLRTANAKARTRIRAKNRSRGRSYKKSRRFKGARPAKYYNNVPAESAHSRTYFCGEKHATTRNSVSFQPVLHNSGFVKPIGIGSPTIPDLIYTAAGFADSDNKSLFIESEKIKYTFQNQTSTPCFVTVHEVMMRQPFHGSVTAGDDFYQQIIGKGFLDVGLLDSGGQSIGVTIGQNPRFRRWCKVLKSTKFEMAPGDKIYYNQFRNTKKTWSFVYKNDKNWNETYSVPRGLKFLLLETQGGIMHDVATTLQMGTTPCVIDCLAVMKMYYRLNTTTTGAETHIASVLSGFTAPVTEETFEDNNMVIDVPNT